MLVLFELIRIGGECRCMHLNATDLAHCTHMFDKLFMYEGHKSDNEGVEFSMIVLRCFSQAAKRTSAGRSISAFRVCV